jgi:Mn-containing catalase
MIVRDHMHQVLWLAAIEEFGGPEAVLPVPADFPRTKEMGEYAFAFMSYAADPAESTSRQGRWTHGPSVDGKGEFSFIAEPFAVGQVPHLNPGDPTTHTAPPGGYEHEGVMSEPALMVEKVVSKVTG